MKIQPLSAVLLTALLLNFSCSLKPDSTTSADKANDQKVENANAAGTAPTTAATPGDAKDVAAYLVDLANIGRTEYELSQLAAVKAYAAQTVAQHAQDETTLKAEAAKYGITLPTALNHDSQELLTSLGQEKAGMDFDRKYLTDMADVNERAIGKEKSVVASTDKSALKQFVAKVMADDERHLAEARHLHDALR